MNNLKAIVATLTKGTPEHTAHAARIAEGRQRRITEEAERWSKWFENLKQGKQDETPLAPVSAPQHGLLHDTVGFPKDALLRRLRGTKSRQHPSN